MKVPTIILVLIAVLFFGVYGYTTYGLIRNVSICGDKIYACTEEGALLLTEGFTEVHIAIGGLLGALVAAVFAVTDPNDNSGGGSDTLLYKISYGLRQPDIFATVNKDENGDKLTKLLTNFFLLVWFFSGAATMIWGYLIFRDVNDVLTTAGSSFFGLAIGALYALFGLNQEG